MSIIATTRPPNSAAATLRRVARSIALSTGWRRAAIAFLTGALSIFALAPFDIWPILFLTFPVLVWLLDGVARNRWRALLAAAGIGWWFGFGYFLAGLYWIGHAFLVDAGTFGWLLPIAVAGLPAGMAVYTGLGSAIARVLWTRGPLRILALAVGLTIGEWLRGHLLSGFPWNAFGYALTGPLALAQGAALIGLWGLTFLAVASFASPAVLGDERADTPRPWLALLAAALALAALAIFGAIRLAANPTTFVDGVRLRIMQPNLSQDAKFNYGAKAEVMRRYLTLSGRSTGPRPSGLKDVTHLIWPESAFPFFLAREPDAIAQIAGLLPEGTVLITGAARLDEPRPGRGLRAYNSIYVIDHDGAVLSRYDKLHLVPFGEYLPFQDWLERLGLMQLTKVQGGFLAGDGRPPLSFANAPAALPLICYEIIFPGEAVPAGERPGWLLNLTNDGWFGISSGPYQHFQQARVRAIEEGLPLVRAANTGISAVVDPAGRVLDSLPLASEGVLDTALPQRIEPPLYARVGDAIPALFIAGAVVMLIYRRRRR